MRAHYKERFDFKKNLVDWDYNMYLKEMCPYINFREYRQWRLKGLAFEARLADATQPNRTLGSFVEGKDKKSRDSILVRGYWGDVIQSPYQTFGLEVDKEPERTKFFREINY